MISSPKPKPPRHPLAMPVALALLTLSVLVGGRAVWASTLECRAVPSRVLGREVNVCVVLPDDYAASGTARYPTLYFLHGLFENERSWSDRGGQQVRDDLERKGELGKFLVVLPDGGKTFYVNSRNGREPYEDFLIQELVPYIDGKHRTLARPSARGISGTSMGGYGALRLGMRHPEVFGSASAHSAALIPSIPNPVPTEGRWGFYARVLQGPFGSPLDEGYWEANSPLTLAEHPGRFSSLKLYFDCGDRDRYGFEEGAQLLHQKLAAQGFPHEFALRPGDHGWSYLAQYLRHSLLFHWRWFNSGTGALAAAEQKAGVR